MPSEYDIYRAYAGLNRSKSGFDTFMEGLKEIQAGARADRQLDIQERAQVRQEETLKFNQDQIIQNRERQKETDKVNEMKMLLSITEKPYQQSQILSKYGYSDLAKNKMDEHERGVDLESVYNQSWEGDQFDQLSVLSEYLGNANPEDKFYQDARSRRSDLLDDVKDTDKEILSDIEFGGQYQVAFNALTNPVNAKKPQILEAAKKELVRLKDAYRESQGILYKEATKPTSILPKEAEDLDESNATSLLEGGTDDRLFKGYDDFDLDELSGQEWAQLGEQRKAGAEEGAVEVAGESKEPTAKVVTAGMGGKDSGLSDDAKKLVSSKKYDISKIENLSRKQRVDLISNILGRKVGPQESGALYNEIWLSQLGEKVKGGLKEGARAASIGLKYP